MDNKIKHLEFILTTKQKSSASLLDKIYLYCYHLSVIFIATSFFPNEHLLTGL